MTNLTKMHAVRRIAGIIVLFTIIGFSMTACDDGNGNTHTCSFSTTWSSNATTHYKQCSCGEKIDVENHVGNPCNVCGYNSGGSSSYSLDGIWDWGGLKITVSGNTGIWSSFNGNALTQDAINKGYYTLGGQAWRNLTSTGNLTWSGQLLGISYNTSSPNVATGTQWINVTFTMTSDGQTINGTTTSGNLTYTRSSYKLDGVWDLGGMQITVSDSTGITSAFGSLSASGQDAVNKGYWKLGDQYWRNLTSIGNLTWSGQTLVITINLSNPNVATGTQWSNSTFTMSTNGQTINVTTTFSDGTSTITYTRKR